MLSLVTAGESAASSKKVPSVGIFIGALHPQEGLHVDHVARAHRRDLAAYLAHGIDQRLVHRPRWPRSIVKRQTAAAQRLARHGRLEKEMLLGLGDKAKDGCERPGQNPRLTARQRVERRNPAGKADLGRLF